MQIVVLGGEPLLNDDYINYLFDILSKLTENDATKFNNGIIIQTNGIYTGAGNVETLKNRLFELYNINPDVIIAIETSIKGTNQKEVTLLARSHPSLFQYNINSYYKLCEINAPNLRPTVIAGFGFTTDKHF